MWNPASTRPTNLAPTLQLDVFTPIPHAFAWLTEQRPVATVLGSELDLRLFGYRDTTPLRAGQIDDEPYGGGAGMVLRVDVVAAALDAVYGGMPEHRVIALTPQGRQLTQSVVEELAEEERLTLALRALRGLRRADRRSTSRRMRSRSARTSSPAASCRRWCSSTRSRDGSRARSPRTRASTSRSPPSSTAGSSTRTTRDRPSSAAGRFPRSCSRAITSASTSGGARRAARGRPVSDRFDPRRPAHRRAGAARAARRRSRRQLAPPPDERPAAARLRAVAARDEPPPPPKSPAPAADETPWRPSEESRGRTAPSRSLRRRPQPPQTGLNPLVRLGVPQPWRGIIDWIVTIVGAIAIVFAIKSWVVNPYRIPSSSMEPTLHCARTGGSGCLARFSDRVLANRFIYHFRDPRRGEIIVFNVPKAARGACGAGGVFVKRIIGLPGDVWQERQGFVYINGKKLNEPYVKKDRRDFESGPPGRSRRTTTS